MEKTKWKSFVNGQGDEYIASMATLEAMETNYSAAL